MHESSLPGAAGRLSPNDPSGLDRRLTAILQASPAPTVCVARSREDGGDLMVAGTSLLEHVRHRVAALQRAGMRRGDVLASDAAGVSRVVDALAAILGNFVYWPCTDARRITQGPLVSDSGAPLVWRPNPLVGIGPVPGMPHEPPAALPMRLSIALQDAMVPAGPQVRALADGGAQQPPFAINAHTIARLGSTLRRRLGIRRQSVRYCAAPMESATGLLLDLLPGFAARQVIVVPNEPSPSSVTIARALTRYHPDSMTVTLAQARALVETPMDDAARTALRAVTLLIGDTHPVPTSLRARLTPMVKRLDIAYILAESGDAYLL
ncbi:MAG TPA: hypothetical protein VE861_16350 [Gemmatimonadaceae bacterium]|nr:hypothetical protein [Gemmatimonadaceae bacterium]